MMSFTVYIQVSANEYFYNKKLNNNVWLQATVSLKTVSLRNDFIVFFFLIAE